MILSLQVSDKRWKTLLDGAACGGSGARYILLMCITGFPGLYSCFHRSRLRKQYRLKGGCCGDCMRHLYWEICALTQEYRELQNRGFDMSIGISTLNHLNCFKYLSIDAYRLPLWVYIYAGWRANVEKKQGLAMTAVVEKGMSK